MLEKTKERISKQFAIGIQCTAGTYIELGNYAGFGQAYGTADFVQWWSFMLNSLGVNQAIFGSSTSILYVNTSNQFVFEIPSKNLKWVLNNVVAEIGKPYDFAVVTVNGIGGSGNITNSAYVTALSSNFYFILNGVLYNVDNGNVTFTNSALVTGVIRYEGTFRLGSLVTTYLGSLMKSDITFFYFYANGINTPGYLNVLKAQNNGKGTNIPFNKIFNNYTYLKQATSKHYFINLDPRRYSNGFVLDNVPSISTQTIKPDIVPALDKAFFDNIGKFISIRSGNYGVNRNPLNLSTVSSLLKDFIYEGCNSSISGNNILAVKTGILSQYNGSTSIPVSLNTLDVSGNQMSGASVITYSNLASFYMNTQGGAGTNQLTWSGQQISMSDFYAYSVRLTSFSLTNSISISIGALFIYTNNLTSFAFTTNVQIGDFRAYGNQIDSWDFSTQNSLTSVYLGNGSTVGNTPSGNGSIVNISSKTTLTLFYFNNSKIAGSVDFTGCSALADLRGNTNPSLTEVKIPTGTALKTVFLYGCAITAAGLSTLINSTGVTNLRLGDGVSAGQTGSGLGALNISPMSALLTCYVNNCGIAGALTISSTAPLSTGGLRADNNPLLTSISTVANTCVIFTLLGCKLTAVTIPTGATTVDVSGQTANGGGIATIDVSGQTVNMVYLIISSSSVTSVSLPTTSGRTITRFECRSNSGLTGLTFPSGLTFIDSANNNNFYVDSCALNITFPLGTNILCRNILLQNNAISQANVDATINNLFTGRASFNNSVSKTLNISGTNSSPTGTYQMPTTGYSGSIHDLTESALTTASAGWAVKEKIWVLVNLQTSSTIITKRYLWTITFS